MSGGGLSGGGLSGGGFVRGALSGGGLSGGGLSGGGLPGGALSGGGMSRGFVLDSRTQGDGAVSSGGHKWQTTEFEYMFVSSVSEISVSRVRNSYI